MSPVGNGQPLNWRRMTVGCLAVTCLLTGGANFLTDPEQSTGTTGMLIRIGLVLGAIWLALPQLETLKSRLSVVALLIALLVLVIAASRPNIFRIVAGVVAAGLAVNWGLRWLATIKGKPNRH